MVVSFHDGSPAVVANNSLVSHSTNGWKIQTPGQGTLTIQQHFLTENDWFTSLLMSWIVGRCRCLKYVWHGH